MAAKVPWSDRSSKYIGVVVSQGIVADPVSKELNNMPFAKRDTPLA
jgi:hypothetical protein